MATGHEDPSILDLLVKIGGWIIGGLTSMVAGLIGWNWIQQAKRIAILEADQKRGFEEGRKRMNRIERLIIFSLRTDRRYCGDEIEKEIERIELEEEQEEDNDTNSR